MKYLFINVVVGNTSTGRIAAEQCRELQKKDMNVYLHMGVGKLIAMILRL